MSWPLKKSRKLRWRSARKAWVLLTSAWCDARRGPRVRRVRGGAHAVRPYRATCRASAQDDALGLQALAALAQAAAAHGPLVAHDDEAVVAADEGPLLVRRPRCLEEEKADGELCFPLGRERDAVAPDPEREVVAVRLDLDLLR